MTGIVEVVIQRAGGVVKTAAALKIHHTAVIGWRKSKQIPAKRVAALHALTGIPCHEMRPDVFPAPDISEDVATLHDMASAPAEGDARAA